MSGIDTKMSPRVSLHAAMMMSFLLLKQYTNEANDTHLLCFKSSAERLNLEGGGHLFISEQMLGKKIASATDKDLEVEKERFKAVCFILRADENRYKSLSKVLKSAAYRGRDEYPITLTSASDLSVRESGNFEQRTNQPFYRGGRGGRSGRGGVGGISGLSFTQIRRVGG